MNELLIQKFEERYPLLVCHRGTKEYDIAFKFFCDAVKRMEKQAGYKIT